MLNPHIRRGNQRPGREEIAGTEGHRYSCMEKGKHQMACTYLDVLISQTSLMRSWASQGRWSDKIRLCQRGVSKGKV